MATRQLDDATDLIVERIVATIFYNIVWQSENRKFMIDNQSNVIKAFNTRFAGDIPANIRKDYLLDVDFGAYDFDSDMRFTSAGLWATVLTMADVPAMDLDDSAMDLDDVDSNSESSFTMGSSSIVASKPQYSLGQGGRWCCMFIVAIGMVIIATLMVPPPLPAPFEPEIVELLVVMVAEQPPPETVTELIVRWRSKVVGFALTLLSVPMIGRINLA